jgi:hypothetical protein
MRGTVRSALGGRRRVRLDLLLGVVVVGAVAAAILVHDGAASPPAIATSSPQPVVVAFAQSYLNYLDGLQAASSLPAASASVRSIAAGASPIPPSARSGRLKISALRVTYVRGALSAQAVAVGRDRAHAYGFSLALRYVSGRWSVVYLVPPDVPTIVARRSAPPAPAAGLERAAADFALAYAGYREGVRREPPAGLSTVMQQIAAGRDPLASIAPSHVAPRLVSVQIGPAVDGAASASAVLSDRGRRLQFDFDLGQSGGQWLPAGFPEAG